MTQKFKIMLYYNKSKENSYREERAKAESALPSLLNYLSAQRLVPTTEEIADIIKDRDGLRRYIFDNKFQSYIKAAYGSAFVPDQKLAEEKRPFTVIYNFAEPMSFYNSRARFEGVMDMKLVEGTESTFKYDDTEFDAFIEKNCRFKVSDKVEYTVEYLKLYTKVLNDSYFDPIREGYITKDPATGVYKCDPDRFILNNLNLK